MNDQFARIPVNNIITGEYKSIGRLEWWDW